MKSEALQATEDYSAAKAVAPRVSLDDIKAAIASEIYFTAGAAARALEVPAADGLDLLTICILTTSSGFSVIGKSAPASPENFDVEKGQTFAYEDAVKQLWPLMGFALREKLAQAPDALFEPHNGMRRYIGTKAVNARPITRGEYCELRGWTVPENEGPMDPGYLVEYTDKLQDPPNVPGFKGYVTWSPADVFERAYR